MTHPVFQRGAVAAAVVESRLPLSRWYSALGEPFKAFPAALPKQS